MKLKNIYFALAALCASAPSAASAAGGDWKIYPTYGQGVESIIDSPDKTYFLSLTQPYSPDNEAFSNKYFTLFVYDKEADEIIPYSNRNYLSRNVINCMNYNPEKKYLIVVYDDYGIDFLFENGKTESVHGLKTASITASKHVNNISFDNANNKVYLATDFGYLVLDDKKFEISSSVTLGKKVQAAARVADRVLIADQTKLYSVAADEKFVTNDKLAAIDGLTNVTQILPLSGNKFAAIVNNTSATANNGLHTAVINGNTLSESVKVSPQVYSIATRNSNGYYLSRDKRACLLTMDGAATLLNNPDEDASAISASWDGKNIWFYDGIKGISSKKLDNGTWTLTRQSAIPNAPGIFRPYYMAYSPNYGILLQDFPSNRVFPGWNVKYPSRLSGFKDGTWTLYADPRKNPIYKESLLEPNGLEIDPDSPNLVWSGSWWTGIVRYNLDDPNDIVRITTVNNRWPNIGTTFPVLDNGDIVNYDNHVSPTFDASGNLWFANPFPNLKNANYTQLYVLPAQARKSGRFDGVTKIHIDDNWTTDKDMVINALKLSSNNGIIVISSGPYNGDILIYDSNKTPTDLSDDRKTYITSTLKDNDGGTPTMHHVMRFYEDPSTGLVWVLTDGGLFTFNPRTIFSNPNRVNRIKVSRNDGTNLADYLLDGVCVYDMTTDKAGRKYFATAGGLVVTSADGKEILEQYTSENSYLPSDVVYNVEYNPNTNSVMLSTSNGVCEFFPTGSSTGENFDAVKIYPNPVRPDYYGWINIEGLLDGSLVKIVDSAGNLVKELGLVSGGTAQWDGTNIDLKRVRSGVYFVMMSSGPGDTSAAKVGKILVVN